MTSTKEAKLTKAQQELVDVNDRIIFATWFTFAGLMMGLACLVGGTLVWYTAAALLLAIATISAILLLRLWQRHKKLHRRGVQEPDFGQPPAREGIKRMLHPGDEAN
jgi:high-affinity nickel permease